MRIRRFIVAYAVLLVCLMMAAAIAVKVGHENRSKTEAYDVIFENTNSQVVLFKIGHKGVLHRLDPGECQVSACASAPASRLAAVPTENQVDG
jgi:hypothetical protein